MPISEAITFRAGTQAIPELLPKRHNDPLKVPSCFRHSDCTSRSASVADILFAKFVKFLPPAIGQAPRQPGSYKREASSRRASTLGANPYLRYFRRRQGHCAKRSRPIRLTGDALNRSRKAASSRSRNSASGGRVRPSARRKRLQPIVQRTCSKGKWQAVVAAIDPVAHRHAEFFRDMPFMLNGEIGRHRRASSA